MTVAAQTKSKVTRRVVAIASAVYQVPGVDPEGRKLTRVKIAQRGDVVEITAVEEQRLDGLGALLPVGSTPQDAFDRVGAGVEAMHAERRGA